MTGTLPKDLVAVVADRDMDAAITELLHRHAAFGIRPISFDTFPHPEHDPGCLKKADGLLRPLRGSYRKAIVVFDKDGSGAESSTTSQLESKVEKLIRSTGWAYEDVRAIVLDPELEAWIWSDSPEVDRVLGWSGRSPSLREWLVDNESAWITVDSGQRRPAQKPDNPKLAFEQALRIVKKPRSSSYYAELAKTVGVNRCVDPAFLRFKETLFNWFRA